MGEEKWLRCRRESSSEFGGFVATVRLRQVKMIHPMQMLVDSLTLTKYYGRTESMKIIIKFNLFSNLFIF